MWSLLLVTLPTQPNAVRLRSHGGRASVLCLAPHDGAQNAEWPALFERNDAYVAWRDTAAELQQALPALTETEARRRLRLGDQHLDGDAPLRRIAGVVHCVDVGGIAVPEAAGLGLRELHADDDALAAAAATLFDALYAAPAPTPAATP